MKKRKGFVSIEVILVSLLCSFIVNILMENSFQRRKELDRSFKIVSNNIDKDNEEEEFLKYILKESILNKDTFESLDFSINNTKAKYILEDEVLNIKIKDKKSGLYRDTYYEIKFIEDEIILSKRGNYEFVSKNFRN